MGHSPPLLSQSFSSQLVSRLLAVLGAASLTTAHASCTANAVGTGGATTATGGNTTSVGGAGGATLDTGITFDSGVPADALGPPPPSGVCLSWAADAGACPVDPSIVLFVLDSHGCTDAGVDSGGPMQEASQIVSGPTTDVPGECCYVVDWQWCINGGRPYLVDDSSRRTAPAVHGARAWCASALPHPAPVELTVDERAALAAAWTADALAEHASVASFSRFSLSLLAAGAPAELLALTHRAALDEIRHAELCFALAGTYAGEPVAPGPFPVGERIDVSASLPALAASCALEGCVGETVAAVLAAEQHARAQNPAVRAALAEIAADEARHAELAWRTVAWALETGGSPVREALERAFASLSPRVPDPAGAAGERGSLEAHGRLDASTTADVVASAIAGVVLPAARALLTASPRGTRPDPRLTGAGTAEISRS